MLNHYHLLLSPTDGDQLARSMAALAWRYSRYFNRKYERTGTLWERRYHSTIVDDESYLLRCIRYIEQNPVRANVVETPRDYQWSSYGCHGHGQRISWLTPHPVYASLGATVDDRAATYRQLCGETLTDDELLTVRIR
jgi:putative transposase